MAFKVSAPAGGDSFWGAIGGIVVGPDGFYAFDRLEHKLYGFTTTGKLSWSVGREGSGPGEFKRGRTVVRTRSGTLLVPDPANARVTAIDRAGTFLRSYPFKNMSGVPAMWFSLEERLVYLLRPTPTVGLALRPDLTQSNRIIAHDLAGREDTLATFAHQEFMSFPAPGRLLIRPRPVDVLVASDGDNVYTATSDSYRISVLSASGRARPPISRNISAVAVDGDERKAMEDLVANVRKDMPVPLRAYKLSVEYPANMPIIARMVAGDGLLLVLRSDIAAKDGRRIWDIFDRGQYAGVVAMPGNFRPEAIGGGRLYGVQKDDDGIETLLVVRLARPSGR